MFDIITVGSATLDVFLKSDKFAIGKRDREKLVLSGGKQEISEKYFAVGGGGTNAGVGFARLGWQTACVARFGRDWAGQWIKQTLSKEELNLDYLSPQEGEETDYATILLSPEGERIILVCRGKTRLDNKTFPLDLIAKTKWLYISSLEGNMNLLEALLNKAEKNQVKVAFNPGRRELEQKKQLKKALPKLASFQLNEEEAKILAGEDFWPYFKDCGADLVVVTKGREGAEFLSSGKIEKRPIIKEKTVDATGAGDAFGTGLVNGLMQERPVGQAVQMGMIESASVVAEIGAKAGLLHRRQLEERMKKYAF